MNKIALEILIRGENQFSADKVLSVCAILQDASA